MATNPLLLPENLGRITAADGNYPYGSAKDDTTGTAGDGTPIRKDWMNDTYGFQQWLLNEAGIVPSGNAETVLASDFGDALNALFARYLDYISGTIQSTTDFWYPDGGAGTVILTTQVAESTNLTIGPTGSGAGYEWSAMDNIPDVAATVKLHVYGTATSDSANVCDIDVYAADGDTVVTDSANYQIFRDVLDAAGAGETFGGGIGIVDVPLNSSKVFTARWSSAFTSSPSIGFNLRGFSAISGTRPV